MFPTSVRLKNNVCNGESFSVAAASEQERLQGCRTPLVSEDIFKLPKIILPVAFILLRVRKHVHSRGNETTCSLIPFDLIIWKRADQCCGTQMTVNRTDLKVATKGKSTLENWRKMSFRIPDIFPVCLQTDGSVPESLQQ